TKLDVYSFGVVLLQILTGQTDLHGQQKPIIYHLDLKPSNIYVDKDMMPKFTEIGLKICLGMGTNGIVKYNGRIVLADNIYRLLCLECMPKGNLGMHLSDEHHPKMDWRTRLNIAVEICLQLHSTYEGLCHVDLKPANVLLDENMVAKIADFGLARFYEEEQARNMRSSIRKQGYMAPELLNNEGIIQIKSDVYSFGIVL
ncbi:unnamed protein product, partial [Urochloa humidicola]